MTDLVRRALLGDRGAQKECTAQGVALPCPFCSKKTTKTCGYMGLTFYKCRTCGATVSFDLPKYNKGLANTDAAWNARAKPPVGECGTCKDGQACEFAGVFKLKGINGYCLLYRETNDGK